jgi:7-carboxy-7-deazaguanine synthase
LQETGQCAWKFVVTGKGDVAEIRGIVHTHDLRPVYIMPEGITTNAIQQHLREIVDAVLEEGWNLTSRLQIEIWGNKRGV